MLLKTAAIALLSAGLVQAQSSVVNSAAPTASGSAVPASNGNVTLPRWNWLDPAQKMHGVALGNWLLLEKWMNWDWFISSSGSTTAEDEWSWSAAAGDRGVAELTEHWNTWVTEDHIRNISENGFNHIRIPFGYWAFIEAPNTPYFALSGQQDQINRVLGYCQQYNLYAMLDLHGLPGSQNGEGASGHRNNGSPDFWNDDNQALGDQTIDAIIAFVEASPYRNLISGVEVCNEPVYYTDGQYQTLRRYYERTYEKMSTLADPIPMIFHPGSPNSNPLDSWQPFINGKNASLLIFEIHPYIGRGASLDGTSESESSLIGQLCSVTQSYIGYGVPVAITEWSLTNPIVNDSDWDKRWFAVQSHMYAQSGGGIFWSLYVNSTTSYAGDENISFYQYSFIDVLNRGDIPQPAANETTAQYLEGLENPCGQRPTQTWAEIVPSQTPQSTSTGRAQRRSIDW